MNTPQPEQAHTLYFAADHPTCPAIAYIRDSQSRDMDSDIAVIYGAAEAEYRHNVAKRMVQSYNACATIPNPAAIPACLDVIRDFMRRVESGEIRSKRTYAAMKRAMEELGKAQPSTADVVERETI